MNVDRIPFSVVRGSRRTLKEQVADGLRQCVATGRYRAGDVLPTTRELAEALGVSRIVTRQAVRELADAGLVNPKPGIGCVVLGRKGKLWRGTVLFVTSADKGHYHAQVFSDELAEIFVRSGWRFVRIAVPAADTSLLAFELAHPVDFAIQMFDNPAAERLLSASGVPFVAIDSADASVPKGCVAKVPFVRTAAAGEVVACARAAGVSTAWQIGFEPLPDLHAAFGAAGIPIRELLVRPAARTWQPELAVQAAERWFGKLLATGGPKLPDLLYFSDDYACQGALLALTRRGLEAPRDVKVVTFSNCGNGPYYIRPLARVELSPQDEARALAARILGCLNERRPIGELAFATVFRPGETCGKPRIESQVKTRQRRNHDGR